MTVENEPPRDRRAAHGLVTDELWMFAGSAEGEAAFPVSRRKPGHIPGDEGAGLLFPTEVMELCSPDGAESDEGSADIGDLVGMLAADIEAVIAYTLEFRSAEPARRFAAHVTETDLLVALEQDSSEGGHETLGMTVAFMTLTGWLTRIRGRLPDEEVAGEVLGSARGLLGPRCAEIASKASGLLDEVVAIHSTRQLTDDLGDDLLPALIWLAASLVQRYGNGDIAWLRQHY